MPLAEFSCFAALEIKAWPFRAGVMQAMLAENVHHAIISMLPAIRRCLAALDINFRALGTVFMRATPHLDQKYVTREMPEAAHQGRGTEHTRS